MDDIDLREQIARIDKLREEARKFAAEQHKLAAEAEKYRREPWTMALIALSALVGALVGSIPNLLATLHRG